MDGRTPDGRRLDGYTINSPCEPNGSGELKKHTPDLNFEKHFQLGSSARTLAFIPNPDVLVLLETIDITTRVTLKCEIKLAQLRECR